MIYLLSITHKSPAPEKLPVPGTIKNSRFHPGYPAKMHGHSYDDNGITGPDWGHSELVFSRSLPGLLTPLPKEAALSVRFFLLTLLFYAFRVIYFTSIIGTLFVKAREKIKFLIFIFHSSICTSCHCRTDMDRYVQPSCPQLRFRTSSALSTVCAWSPDQKYHPT